MIMMSRYSTTINDILQDEDAKNELLKALSTYPLYKPKNPENFSRVPTREELNTKILNYYRWYEIGSETVGRFLFDLKATMELIMPYYNQKFKSIDIMNEIDDIFGNLDVTESYEENRTGNVKNNSSATSTSDVTSENKTNSEMSTNGRNVNAKTPQSQLSVKTIDKISSASEMSWNEDSNNSNATSNDKSNSTSETRGNANQDTTDKITHSLHRKGNQGVNTYAHDMLEFRNLIMNVEQEIINDPELAKCFMLIW